MEQVNKGNKIGEKYQRRISYHKPISLNDAKNTYYKILHEYGKIKKMAVLSNKKTISNDDRKTILTCLEDLCALSHQKEVQEEYHSCLNQEKKYKNQLRIEPLRRQIISSYFNIQAFLKEYDTKAKS